MYSDEIKKRLDSEPCFRQHLFCRGYLFSEEQLLDMQRYPFYGNWNVIPVGKYYLYSHPLTKSVCCSKGDVHVAITGHAYNPYTEDIDEENIAADLAHAYLCSRDAFFEKLNELTGVFAVFAVSGNTILAVQDCGAQKMLYFGQVDHKVIITSMPQLAGDIFGLEVTADVKTLLTSKGYFRGSGFLPGNLSPYRELTRLGANTCAVFANEVWSIYRFYPARQIEPLRTEEDKAEATRRICALMSKNIELVLRKWPRVALSLTGGMDSKGTLACASDYWDRCHIFSFISKDSEKLDADAAAQICHGLNIPHHLYLIPEDPGQISDYEFLRSIIEHNTSHLCKLPLNEIRKYIWLERLDDFDVEIKSDISEIGRAYTARKYYNVKMPRVLSPRHLTIGQGRYFLEPRAMSIADRAYSSFMKQTALTDDIYGYTMHDLSYWEVRMASWASTSLTSQEYFHDITIPYNNRNLMDLFLRFPHNERVRDIPHKRVVRQAAPAVADMEIQIKDSYFGRKRMLLETAYYYFSTCGNIYGKK